MQHDLLTQLPDRVQFIIVQQGEVAIPLAEAPAIQVPLAVHLHHREVILIHEAQVIVLLPVAQPLQEALHQPVVLLPLLQEVQVLLHQGLAVLAEEEVADAN